MTRDDILVQTANMLCPSIYNYIAYMTNLLELGACSGIAI